MPRGSWAPSDILAQYLRALFGLCNAKRVVVPCLDEIMIAFFPRNIQWSFLFARKARINTERVPHGHPIIRLKSNKFNMAAVSVKKRSIDFEEPRLTLASSTAFCGRITLGNAYNEPVTGWQETCLREFNIFVVILAFLWKESNMAIFSCGKINIFRFFF